VSVVSFASFFRSLLTNGTDNVGDDCPVFDGLFDYCAISAGGSMGEYFINYTQHPVDSNIILII